MSAVTERATGRAAPAERVTLRRVAASEWVKLRSLRSTYWTLGVGVVFMVGIGLLFCAVAAAQWDSVTSSENDFDAAAASLAGIYLSQLAVATLGVLVMTSEYSTGMIRATLSAVPRRLPVLAAKVVVFGAVVLVVLGIATLAAFSGGQALLASVHGGASLGDPGVARAVLGAVLFLTVIGILGVGLGGLVRNTAGSLAILFGLLFVLPIVAAVLPGSWGSRVSPYLPGNAGMAVMARTHEHGTLGPWSGFALFCGYAAAVVVVAGLLLRARDAA
ncbi:MAG: ABC transporter permease [Frankiaceae bacterium]